jgi:CRP/FNR family transcriptional regulator, cyclic AMP receptor protein
VAEKQNKINTFWGDVFSSFSSTEETNRIEILKKIPLFSDLRGRDLKVIDSMVYERRYDSGEYMFETGQPGAAMFIIEEGEVQITRLNAAGEEIVLARLRNGEFLGELALLDNSPRSASALVVKATKALAIFREDLDKLLDSHPDLGGKVMKKLAVIIGIRLKATNEMLMKNDQD